jgi:hypothetical protein
MHVLVNGTLFGKKIIEDEIWAVVSSAKNLSETFLILRETHRGIMIHIHTYIHLHVKYPLLLPDVNET